MVTSDVGAEQASRKPIVVLKFGGTSVADAAGRTAVCARVHAALELDMAPVVVVSAMGRKGAPYATDTLLSLVDAYPTDVRERDLLMSAGEIISAVVVAHELRAAGIASSAYSGAEAGIVTTEDESGTAVIQRVHPDALLGAIDDGRVPVVAGFQGISEDGRITTLGRGGSDTTACALGVALSAREVDIYTDVDGVMSADPNACGAAGVLEVISADELFQMARAGSRVVHTPAAELALSSGIPVRVRSTFSEHGGTLVADIAGYRPRSVATAVSHTEGIARVRVGLGASEGSLGHMAAQTRVFRAMADAGISLDMFTPSGDALVFSVPETVLDRATEVIRELRLLHQSHRGLAKVTLVGAGMHGIPGVMAQIAECLVADGVDVYQVADSHTTISVLIPAEQVAKAVHALHEGFGLAEEDPRPAPPGAAAQSQPVTAAGGDRSQASAASSCSPGQEAHGQVRERFGARSHAYRMSAVHAGGKDLTRLIDLVEVSPETRALDLATGAGHTALALAQAGASVVASDITEEMLSEAALNFAENGVEVDVVLADALNLPFPDASFDVVTARMAPHHFPEPGAFVREVARVLRPGGRFGLVDQVAPEDRASAAAINEFEAIRDPSHHRQLPVSEWESLCADAGLQVTHSEVFGKPVQFEWWVSIQDLDAEGQARISALLAHAPQPALDWYAPTFADDGMVTSFTSPHAILLARKPR